MLLPEWLKTAYFQYVTGGILARSPRQSHSRVRAGAAQEQAVNRGPVVRPAQRRSHREQLIERQLSMMNVPPGQPIHVFQVCWGEHLPVFDQSADARGVPF